MVEWTCETGKTWRNMERGAKPIGWFERSAKYESKYGNLSTICFLCNRYRFMDLAVWACACNGHCMADHP